MPITDYRMEGSPADVGVYQMPCSVMVFKHTFEGTDYVCAIRAGERGWILVYYNTSSAANDLAAIQAAIDGLTAGRTNKETVYVKGNYTINGAITAPDYTILDFSDARITLADNSNCNMLENAGGASGNDEIDVVGGIWDGNKANQTAGSIFYFYNCDYITIDGCELRDSYYSGVFMEGSEPHYYNQVMNCRVFEADNDGIRLKYQDHSLVQNNLCQDCGNNYWEAGIAIVSSYYSVVDGNATLWCRDGIVCEGGEEVVVSNNSSYKDGGGGYGSIVLWDGVENCVVVGNISFRCEAHGILVNSSTAVISGNNIIRPSDSTSNNNDCIYIYGGSDYCLIEGNRLLGRAASPYPRHGINIQDNNAIISNNLIYDMGTHGILLDGATNCIATGNRIYNCGLAAGGYGIYLDNDSDYNCLENNYTNGNASGCVNIANANCDNNVFTNNQFDEGNITDAGTNTRAWLNYDPSANSFIDTINPPQIEDGTGTPVADRFLP